MRNIVSQVRRAVENYKMISDGDCVGVGVSGGKDSLTLLVALAKLSAYDDYSFRVKALMVDMGFERADFSAIKRLCDDLGIELSIVSTDIAKVVFDIRQEKSACSLCAKMRRGALNNLAKREGCNKVALGHSMDDAIETYFLSLYYEGRISCFSPVTYLDRVDVTVIRPLIYVEESRIKAYAGKTKLPILHNPCPVDGCTKRQFMKEHICALENQMPGVKRRIFGAIERKLWETEINI